VDGDTVDAQLAWSRLSVRSSATSQAGHLDVDLGLLDARP
jgi:hypothetical protein